MRTLPIAFAYHYKLDKMLQVTSAVSKMTHWEEITDHACQIYNCLILAYLGGRVEKEELIAQMLELYPSTSGLLDMRDLPPSGFVRDSLYHALQSFILTDNFRDCVVRAANLGGDADTIAAIAGGLAGVYYGVKAIPQEWIAALEPEIRAEIYRVSEGLAELNAHR